MSSRFLDALAGSTLYPITDRDLSGRSLADQVLQLSEGGATLVQFREKKLSPAEFYAQAVDGLQVARNRGLKVIINDRVDLALALQADGVHLGQDDMPPEAARRILGPHAIIGFSTHSPGQAAAAARMPIDYLAIGPIFTTASKERPDSPVGLEGLRLVRKAVGNLPVVAIGGITLENGQSVLNEGADAIAVISAIWRKDKQTPTNVKRFLTSDSLSTLG